MSKETPEIGDVWLGPNGKKFHIVGVGDHLVDIMSELHAEHVFSKDYFKRDFTYVGKCKVNINDLFEVEKMIVNNKI